MLNSRLALVVAVVLGVLCMPFASAAQDATLGKTARMGRLSPLSAEADMPGLEAFRKGLRDLGWVEGRDFAIEARFAEGKPERLPELAAQLVRNRVDIILAGSTPGALAAKKATSTIPIVMVTTGDPIEGGLVASLARPGGNITGVTALGDVLGREAAPVAQGSCAGSDARSCACESGLSIHAVVFESAGERGAGIEIQLQVVEAQDPTKLEQAFAAVAGERAGALMVLIDVMFNDNRRRIVELAAKSHCRRCIVSANSWASAA